jgi:GT2 family glycosyltransferase
MEDVDFSYRVGQKYILLYQPDAQIKHLASTYQNKNSRLLRRMLIQNHSYIFKKNFPQDIIHLLAHLSSIFGIFVYNLLFQKDLKACKGVIEGFFWGTLKGEGPLNSAFD